MFLPKFIQRFGAKNTIMIGLILEMLDMICFGLGTQLWYFFPTSFQIKFKFIAFAGLFGLLEFFLLFQV